MQGLSDDLSKPWPAFWRGFVDSTPFILIVVPFSTLFGVVARDAGLDVLHTMIMSIAVIAGASQFTALALLQDHAPVLVALLTSLAVNLRLAMYSAALVPYLGHAPMGQRALMSYLMVDQAYAVAGKKYEEAPQMLPGARVGYYFGVMAMVCPLWYACTLMGALVGQALPASLSLDFAVPACFIALLAPLMRSAPHRVAALVSAVASIALAWLPWSLNITLAALLGLIAGAQMELFLQRRAQA
jgi:4-azaleucine resistance transporter AzlC